MAGYDHVTASAYMFVTGTSANVNILSLSGDETDVDALEPLELDAVELGIPGFSRNVIFVCDIPSDTSTCTLQSYSLGGFMCHHIYAPVVNGNDFDAEIMRARAFLQKVVAYRSS